ncbi:baseplate J/gp47 family protein [Kingella kingae]|uniref:baseplate J/gp47 family protein n=1 Tax=Kingella kingae TaxID=504 RepID=UPI0006864A14|nr:baseplate J/gp47 family protein [Kingella kingae]
MGGCGIVVGDVVFNTIEQGQLTTDQPQIDLQAACTQTGERGNGWSVGQINTLQSTFYHASHSCVGRNPTENLGYLK